LIAIVDYGMGNLRSVQKALEKLGYQASITSDPQVVEVAGGVVLPGVGAFADAMANLHQGGLVQAMQQFATSGRPLLGICLGMQLLFESSEEDGEHQGLGLLPGRVLRLPPGLKIPHMGWNQVRPQGACPLLAGIPEETDFYFVHSYYVSPGDAAITAGVTEYGIPFSSVVARGNLYGVQFHPEKSSRWGLALLKNFGELVVSC